MSLLGRRLKVFSIIFTLMVSLGVLSSCASKGKKYSSKTNPFPYNVVSVNVTSLDPAGDEFARHLEFHLKQSAGSPAFAKARNVKLRISTHPNGMLDKSTKSLFRQVTSLGGTSVTATIRLIDHENGASLKYEQITSSSTKDDIEVANMFIAEDMIAQIRAILGLTMYPPRPISNAPISVEPHDAALIFKPEHQMADPLLNGQINPSKKPANLSKQIKDMNDKMSSESMQMKRKVNNEAKMVRDVLMEDMAAPEKDVMPKKEMKREMEAMKKDVAAQEDAADSEAADNDALGDLCIVTVENDCLGPNISQ